MIETATKVMMWCGIAFLVVGMLLCLVRGVLGRRFTDRVISINLVATKTIILIAMLSFILDEGGLIDVAMVYALISFLAVVVLSKCYLLPHHKNPANAKERIQEDSKNA